MYIHIHMYINIYMFIYLCQEKVDDANNLDETNFVHLVVDLPSLNYGQFS